MNSRIFATLNPRFLSTLAVGLSIALNGAAADNPAARGRQVISLNGTWEIAEGSKETFPTQFEAQVPVPGLVDQAQPPFIGVGADVTLREAFWYRRTFSIVGDVPPTAHLKIHKAAFGAQVWINRRPVGGSLASFTPNLYDIGKVLRSGGSPNEVLIRVLAHRRFLPPSIPGGWDFEKYKYLPGLFDSVEVILSGTPSIVRVQTAPDLIARAVRLQATLRNDGLPTVAGASFIVREAKSRREVGRAESNHLPLANGEEKIFDANLSLSDCHLWSPEDPFLYELETTTGPDTLRTRFGMRSFRFDAATGRAILNGQPYYLRGSNITLYRFFEDDARGDLPWRPDWVRSLHRKMKSMNWNSLRYCIGFPPEFWYDIADEEGLLIQDEFPIWLLGDAPEKPEAAQLVPQYTAWMQERWNHPSVVIWDAQNESQTAETGKALQAVRHLDLSDRPWDNGWAEPQSPTDCVEAHPYLMINAWQGKDVFRMRDMPTVSPVPPLQEAQRKLQVPILINEYAWLWLTRDGQPTSLTDKVYEQLLGPNSTVAQRRHLYARTLAAKTEFWRAHRKCAGVLHFCALGYSRPGHVPRPIGGATSDHWLDVEKLVFEPEFERYVKDAFAPVGLMIDFWAEQQRAGTTVEVPVIVINDTAQRWEGDVVLTVRAAGKRVSKQTIRGILDPAGATTLVFQPTLPGTATDCQFEATLAGPTGPVSSLRDFKTTGP